jgi:hypothetical protein
MDNWTLLLSLELRNATRLLMLTVTKTAIPVSLVSSPLVTTWELASHVETVSSMLVKFAILESRNIDADPIALVAKLVMPLMRLETAFSVEME